MIILASILLGTSIIGMFFVQDVIHIDTWVICTKVLELLVRVLPLMMSKWKH